MQQIFAVARVVTTRDSARKTTVLSELNTKVILNKIRLLQVGRSVLNDNFNRKHGEILDTTEKIQSVSIRFS